MTDKILLVDDDPNILAACTRALRKQFCLETAPGGEEGLEAIREQGPFAVIVADMGMPGMNGVQFLSRVKESAPNSVRMMLTGNADQQTAIDAVNEGNIFRFLAKPCPSERLASMLDAGIQQYRLIVAERELLEKTLKGSVKILTEILSMVNPAAFSRASRITRYVKHIVEHLELSRLWQFEMAAMLSQIGCVTVPPDILDKVYAKQPLSEEERKMYSSHPSVAGDLLVNIPRLEAIARMIEGQQKPFDDYPASENRTREEATTGLGSQILKTALDFDELVVQGSSAKAALSRLRSRDNEYNPKLLFALETLPETERAEAVRMVGTSELRANMVADENIRAESGLLLVSKGQEISETVLIRLRNFSRGVGVVEPFRVRVMSQGSQQNCR
jgi:response regulator RpfG family c-di-GMP phosphodiesterase